MTSELVGAVLGLGYELVSQPLTALADTAKCHSDGAPVLQILWKESALAELDRIAGRAAAIA